MEDPVRRWEVAVMLLLMSAVSVSCGVTVDVPPVDDEDAGEVASPSICRAVATQEECCSSASSKERCVWLFTGELRNAGAPGACIHQDSENCAEEANTCPSGQSCHVYDTGGAGECQNYYYVTATMGVCVDE